MKEALIAHCTSVLPTNERHDFIKVFSSTKKLDEWEKDWERLDCRNEVQGTTVHTIDDGKEPGRFDRFTLSELVTLILAFSALDASDDLAPGGRDKMDAIANEVSDELDVRNAANEKS